MAEIRVGFIPPSVNRFTVKSGLDVNVRVYRNAARLNNWILARGGQLVPATVVNPMIASDSQTLHFSLYPRAYAKHRAWIVGGRPTGTTPFQVTITAGGSSSTFTFTAERPTQPQFHLAVVASPNDTVHETSITLACPAGSGSGFVDSVACFEVPRPILSPEEDLVTSEEMFAEGRPIGAGVTALVQNIHDTGPVVTTSHSAVNRRNGIFYWSVPTSAAFSTTSTTYVNIFDLLKPPALAAYTTDVEERINFRVYARSMGGSTASFRVETTSGNAQTRSIGGTGVWEWWSSGIAASSVDVDAEDLSATDGRRSSRWDELTFQVKASSGFTVEVAAISIGRHKHDS